MGEGFWESIDKPSISRSITRKKKKKRGRG
jgi:hypothetical protein